MVVNANTFSILIWLRAILYLPSSDQLPTNNICSYSGFLYQTCDNRKDSAMWKKISMSRDKGSRNAPRYAKQGSVLFFVAPDLLLEYIQLILLHLH